MMTTTNADGWTILDEDAGLLTRVYGFAPGQWARTLVDLLQRRCMAGLDAHCGLEMAPAAADWLFRLGLWDKRGAEAELAAYRAPARRFRVPGAGASVPFT